MTLLQLNNPTHSNNRLYDKEGKIIFKNGEYKLK